MLMWEQPWTGRCLTLGICLNELEMSKHLSGVRTEKQEQIQTADKSASSL